MALQLASRENARLDTYKIIRLLFALLAHLDAMLAATQLHAIHALISTTLILLLRLALHAGRCAILVPALWILDA